MISLNFHSITRLNLLKISGRVSHLMQVLEREDDLGSVDPHFALLELLSLVKVGEQLPATHIICKIILSYCHHHVVILSLTKD